MAATKIAEHIGIPTSSLSVHLKELVHADLIVPHQDGRFVIYAADIDNMNALIGFLTGNCCCGAPCTTPQGAACDAV